MCVHYSPISHCELLYQNTPETLNPHGNMATQKCGLSCSEVGVEVALWPAWLCLREACTPPTGSGTSSRLRVGAHAPRVAIPALFSCWENLRIWWGIFRRRAGATSPSSSLVLGPESLGRTIPHSEARGLVAPGFWVYLCWDDSMGGEDVWV